MGLTQKAQQFLKKVEHERGRPLRVLFLGNIACNSYNNAKILRDRGVDTFETPLILKLDDLSFML